MIAWINGGIGIALSFWIGTHYAGLSEREVSWGVFCSIMSGFITLGVTLRSEKTPWIRKYFLNRSFKTWTLFLGLYAVCMGIAVPFMSSFWVGLMMTPSLILSSGITIGIFGPIQDRLLGRSQLRARRLNNRV